MSPKSAMVCGTSVKSMDNSEAVFECGHVCALVVVVGIGIPCDGQIFCDSKIMTEGNAKKKV